MLAVKRDAISLSTIDVVMTWTFVETMKTTHTVQRNIFNLLQPILTFVEYKNQDGRPYGTRNTCIIPRSMLPVRKMLLTNRSSIKLDGHGPMPSCIDDTLPMQIIVHHLLSSMHLQKGLQKATAHLLPMMMMNLLKKNFPSWNIHFLRPS